MSRDSSAASLNSTGSNEPPSAAPRVDPSEVGVGLRQRRPADPRAIAEIQSAYQEEEPFAESSDMAFSPIERKQLQAENDQLFRQVNAMVDEITQIEGKVVEISKLQQIFSEKVLEQDVQIGRIGETAIHTTENIAFGNEQIRAAMKSKSAMRVYILFFLIVMSFSLLFLHWYNP